MAKVVSEGAMGGPSLAPTDAATTDSSAGIGDTLDHSHRSASWSTTRSSLSSHSRRSSGDALASTGRTTVTASTRGSQTLEWSSHQHQHHRLSDFSAGGSSRASNYSRRISKVDNTAKPLEPARERSKLQRISSRLECASLRFSNISVAGREREIAELRSAYGRARGKAATPISETGSKELVLIAGESGSGKSRLASTLAERVGKAGGLYAQGKYDLYFRDEPYFGISQACGEIIGHILQLKESGDEDDAMRYTNICDALQEGFGDDEEVYLLATAIAPIVEILGATTAGSASLDASLTQSKEQFKFIFRKFIRIITADPSIFGGPLVIVLDDLQWADNASLELLGSILTDRESSGLLIVGCYRSEEVTDTHILSSTISGLRDAVHSQQIFDIEELHLNPLSTNDVNTILMELLSDDTDRTMPLAELCHRKSLGNPFHLMVFLQMLQDERLLEFNVGSFCWKFDVNLIESKTSATSNVVDMVTARLEQVPMPLQEVLHVAACLGSSFDFDVLFLVWIEMEKRRNARSNNDLDVLIEQAVEENILEADSDAKRYRWTHDQVQEAAMVLGQRVSGDDTQLKVGLVLLAKLKERELDESVSQSITFIIANLLQSGDLFSVEDKQRDDILQIYLEAAKKAVSCSAFKSAAKYAKSAVDLLPADAFASHYDLAIELYSIGAEVEGFLGKYAEMDTYCEEVLLCHHVTNPLDKIRCYTAQLSRLGSTKRTKMACKLCIEILHELGYSKIPSNSLSQKVKAVMALQKVKDVPTETVHALPLMTDPTLLATMRILNNLASYSNLSSDKFLLILASCGMYQLTLEYGLCSLSPGAFIALAVVRNAMSNFAGSIRLCDQALSLLPSIDSKSEKARTLFISYFMVKSWTTPFFNCLRYLQESYKLGIECGDTESGCWGISMYIIMSFLSGTNLNSVLADIRTYLPQVKEFGRDEPALHITIYFQACLCYTGSSKNPTEMSGEAIPNAEEFERELRSLEGKIPLVVYQVQLSFLCTIFGDHERGAKLALERGDALLRICRGPPTLDTFARGISLYEMARRTRKMKYKRAAKKPLSAMRKWAKADNPNAVNKLALLEAEQWALNGDIEKASQSYEKAITRSIRCGALQDAALSCERYGEFSLNDAQEKGKALHYFEKAMKYYEDWGAAAKVRQLNEKYSDLRTVPQKIDI